METNPETTRRDEDSSGTSWVPEADALEQRRELVEEVDDPERTAGTTEPDLTGMIEADPADVRDQTLDVPHEEEPAAE